MAIGNVTCDVMALNKTELLPWDVNSYWTKKKEEISASDVRIIDETAALCREADGRWEHLRSFYEKHQILRMPADIEKKSQSAKPQVDGNRQPTP
jgi:hypothetical protein